EEFAGGHAEHFGQPVEDSDGRVLLAALQTPDVGAVDVGVERKRLLRQPALGADPAQIPGHPLLAGFARHRPTLASSAPESPRTIIRGNKTKVQRDNSPLTGVNRKDTRRVWGERGCITDQGKKDHHTRTRVLSWAATGSGSVGCASSTTRSLSMATSTAST